MGKCTTIRHALSAVKLGVDFLSIDGFECAGHVGETDITNFILLSKARQTMPIQFIASGGFADGQGLAAALSLGAEGINMGTRFMCTVEAPIHDNIKQAIVNGDKDYGVWTAGQVIGLIHDVPTCHDLLSRIEKEAIETLSSASSLIVDKQPEPDIAGKPLGDTTSDPRSDHNKKVPGEAQIYDI